MRKHFRYLLVMFVALLLPLFQISCSQIPQSTSNQPSPRDKLATAAKPAVVRVIAGCIGNYEYKPTDESEPIYRAFGYGISGSGFFINSNGYIATYAIKNESDCKERLFQNLVSQLRTEYYDSEYPDPDSNLRKQYPNQVLNLDESEIRKRSTLPDGNFQYINSVILPHPDSKDYSFEVKESGGPLEDGKDDVSIIKINLEKENAPSLRLGDSDRVRLDDVTVIGYPANDAAADSYEKVLNDKAVYEASVSEGRISNPNKKTKSNSPVLEINVSASYGSAGSPVLNAQGEVIGIIAPTKADRNPFIEVPGEDKVRVRDKGIPLAVPAKKIQEFVEASGTSNKPGEVDEWYGRGLNQFWQGDYEGAIKRFEVVEDLFPEHSEVERLISESNKSKVIIGIQPATLLWGVLGTVIAGLLGLVFFLMRRKPRPVSKVSASAEPERRPRPHITGYPADNGIGQPWVELEGQGQIKKLQLSKGSHRIGRDPAWSDIEIPANWEVLSRHHALLKREDNSYRIFDGDGRVPSRNGLFVDNYTRVDVNEGYLLKPGDTLIIGKDPQEQVRLTYYNPTASQTTPETKVARS
ncbi:MAG: FHA domain-containing protein [Cyanobacteria bacterium RM1_2_2]|nr:FHA domain-containing protein [Cyanobacteria bacterium RM1_2_2]